MQKIIAPFKCIVTKQLAPRILELIHYPNEEIIELCWANEAMILMQ